MLLAISLQHEADAVTMHHGDHACVIYSASTELTSVVTAYLYEGLRAGERCWYAGFSASELSGVRTALETMNVAVADAEARGALRLATADEIYLPDGTFNSERMLQNTENAIRGAVRDGFTGLRLAGEMSWAMQPKPGTDQVMEYEGSVETVLRASAAVGLCLYHRRRMPAELLDDALAKHPLAGVGDQPRPNAFYRSKAIADLRTPQADDVCWKLKHLQRSTS
jgi:hypothetical protein